MRSQGSSLVEVMIAFVAVGLAAVAIYPIFTRVGETSKLGDAKLLCENIVRGKLDEYRDGRPVRLANYAVGKPNINNLSITSFSTAAGPPTRSGGFLYAKVRYNRFFPYSCRGVSEANILTTQVPLRGFNAPPPPAYRTDPVPAADNSAAPPVPVANRWVLGMRECITYPMGTAETSTAWEDGQLPPVPCNQPADSEAQRQLPGFRLYVKLELETSWQHHNDPTDGTTLEDWQYSNTCPNDGTAQIPTDGTFPAGVTVATFTPPLGNTSLYDFNGFEDSIRVTVTGVVDLPPAIPSMGGIADPNRLMCSATAVVRPYRYPARYYVSPDGRIYGINGQGVNASATEFLFANLYTQAGNEMVSGITSVAVSPRNTSIYVLRPGVLTRYGYCGGRAGGAGAGILDCVTEFIDGEGRSDRGVPGRPTFQYWSVPSSIKMISVNFGTGMVYGVSGDGRGTFYQITHDDGSGVPLPGAGITLDSVPGCGSGVAQGNCGDAHVIQVNPTGDIGLLVYNRATNLSDRVFGFFMSPQGDEAFVTDLTFSSAMGGNYSTSIYRLLDAELVAPIITIPGSIRSFSM